MPQSDTQHRLVRLSLKESLNIGVWDQLTTESVYLSAPWLTAFDDPTVAECEVHVAYKGDEVVAALVTHAMPAGSANTVYDVYTLSRSAFSGSQEDWRPQNLLGSRLGQFNTVLVSPKRHYEETLSAYGELAQSVLASLEGATAVLYVPTETARLLLRAANGQLQPILGEVGSVLDASHADFDAYLRSLSSSKRGSVRRDLRDFNGVMSTVPLSQDSPSIPMYAQLMANVQERHEQPASLLALEKYLRRCAAPGLRTIVFEARKEGKLTAFALGIQHGSSLWMRVVGLTYDGEGSSAGDYGHVLVYEPMRYAIDHGLLQVDLGAGVSGAKRLRGARGVALWHLIRAPSSVHPVSSLAAFNRARAAELNLATDELAIGLDDE